MVVEITKGSQGATARIRRAVYQGKGWQYKGGRTVYHTTAGGLTKSQLMSHKGRIVSKKKHAAGVRAMKALERSGKAASLF